MNINISSGIIPKNNNIDNTSKKILIAGKATTNFKAREIIMPVNEKEVLSMYGKSSLYEAYCNLTAIGVNNIYTVNCFAESDYIRLIDKLIHYDFDYFIPMDIYLSSKFYNPIIDKNHYYAAYFLEQLNDSESLTTIIMTERHASLYKDFDDYVITMANIEKDFINNESALLNKCGNNLNFVYNNIQNTSYSNVVLGGLYCTRNYSQYFNSLKATSIVFDINNNDLYGLKAMYFKYNQYNKDVTVENAFNFKNTNDVYSNALIDDVIKTVIKEIDFSKFKGKLYNPYVSTQIESETKRKLTSLKGKMFKSYKVEKISFVKTDKTSGYIVINFYIQPYGTLENINIIMGVA